MNELLEDVRQFHRLLGGRLSSGFTPAVLAARQRYIDEEFGEVVEAFAEVRAEVERSGPGATARSEAARHLVGELIDLTYVIVGTFVELGIDPEPAWQAVQQANMRKQPSPVGGKAVKPAGWIAPSIPLLELRR